MSNTQLNLGRITRHIESNNIPVQFLPSIIEGGVEVDYAILGTQCGGEWVNITKVLISEKANVTLTEFLLNSEISRYLDYKHELSMNDNKALGVGVSFA